MSKAVRLPDDIADALDRTDEAVEHGRAWAAAAFIADRLGIARPPTPNDRRRENAAEHGAAGAEARWGKE